MSLFGRRSRATEITTGDMFRKTGTYGGDWVVDRVFDYPDIPRHVRLIEKNGARTMTVAIAMLADPDHFAFITPASAQNND